MLEHARAEDRRARPRGRIRAGQRARAAVRGRELRRRHGRLRRSQRGRPAARARRDAPRGPAGRTGRGARDHDARAAAAELVLRALVRPGRAAAGHRSPATATPTPTCPNRCGGSRLPPALAKLMHDAGLRDVRYLVLAGGIVAIHAGTVEELRSGRDRPRRGACRGFRSRRCSTPTGVRCGRWSSAPRRELTRAPPATAPRSRAPPRSTLAAGGKRLRPVLVFVCGAGRATASRLVRAARAPSSSCTWRRSSTTTCSTRRCCGGAGRPSTRARAAARDRDGRLPLLAGVCAAGRERRAGSGARAVGCLGGARARRARAARGRLRGRPCARPLPAPLRAEDREPVLGRLPAGRAGRRA